MISLIFIVFIYILFISSLIIIVYFFYWFWDLFILLYLILLGRCLGCMGFLLPVSRTPSSVTLFVVVVVAFVVKGNSVSFHMCVCCANLLQLCLFATLWTVVQKALLSMGFSRQVYWSRLPCPPRVSFQPWSWTGVSCISCFGRWTLHHWAKQRSPCPFTPMLPDNFPPHPPFVFLILGVLFCFGLFFLSLFVLFFHWRF